MSEITEKPTPKLWIVTVESELIVEAIDENNARRIAMRSARDEDEFDAGFAREVKTLQDIPEEWRDAMPYGGDRKDYRSCEDRLK